MNCQTCQIRSAVRIARELDPTATAATQSHIDGCPTCRHAWVEMQSVADRLDQLTGPPLSDAYARRVAQDAMRRACAGQTPRPRGNWLLGAAAAAVVLVSLGSLVVHSGAPTPRQPIALPLSCPTRQPIAERTPSPEERQRRSEALRSRIARLGLPESMTRGLRSMVAARFNRADPDRSPADPNERRLWALLGEPCRPSPDASAVAQTGYLGQPRPTVADIDPSRLPPWLAEYATRLPRPR